MFQIWPNVIFQKRDFGEAACTLVTGVDAGGTFKQKIEFSD
jgi:hypothetical protein